MEINTIFFKYFMKNRDVIKVKMQRFFPKANILFVFHFPSILNAYTTPWFPIFQAYLLLLALLCDKNGDSGSLRKSQWKLILDYHSENVSHIRSKNVSNMITRNDKKSIPETRCKKVNTNLWGFNFFTFLFSFNGILRVNSEIPNFTVYALSNSKNVHSHFICT